ncbi:hypothetical protein D3C80_2016860 [compost metagenome]
MIVHIKIHIPDHRITHILEAADCPQIRNQQTVYRQAFPAQQLAELVKMQLRHHTRHAQIQLCLTF